jgi:hypothetical protein
MNCKNCDQPVRIASTDEMGAVVHESVADAFLCGNPELPPRSSSGPVTITQTASPSRSKMAGPCWIAISATGNDIYASDKTKTVQWATGTAIHVNGRATLRRSTRATTERGSWTLYATGDPADTVTVGVGTGQCGREVQALLTGVSETDPAAAPLDVAAGAGPLAIPANRIGGTAYELAQDRYEAAVARTGRATHELNEAEAAERDAHAALAALESKPGIPR